MVVGRKADLVNRFLYMLSYFIRCSDVHEAPFSNCLPAILDSRCWEQCTPARSVSTEDGSVTPVDAVSCPFHSPAQSSDPSDGNVCGSCPSAIHPHCTQGKKVESLSPKRVVSVERQSVEREPGACEGQRMKNAQGSASRCHSDSECVVCEHKCNQPCSLPSVLDVTCAESEVKVLSDDSGIENSNSYDKDSYVKQEAGVCRMSVVRVVEDSKLERVKHVQRSAEVGPALPSEDSSLPPYHAVGGGGKQDWNSKRPVSMLARQLAADSEALEKQKAKMREVQKQFLNGGSNSMFEEYFEGDAETKTIDDISQHEIVVKHPLVRAAATSPMGGCVTGEEGGMTQPKVSVSRQNSMDTKPHVSRPTSLNPARCRSVVLSCGFKVEQPVKDCMFESPQAYGFCHLFIFRVSALVDVDFSCVQLGSVMGRGGRGADVYHSWGLGSVPT